MLCKYYYVIFNTILGNQMRSCSVSQFSHPTTKKPLYVPVQCIERHVTVALIIFFLFANTLIYTFTFAYCVIRLIVLHVFLNIFNNWKLKWEILKAGTQQSFRDTLSVSGFVDQHINYMCHSVNTVTMMFV